MLIKLTGAEAALYKAWISYFEKRGGMKSYEITTHAFLNMKAGLIP